MTLSCCGTVYELAPETGRSIARGEQVQVGQADLKLIQAGRRDQWRPAADRKRVCENCGFETEEDYNYCPKCGGRLEEP